MAYAVGRDPLRPRVDDGRRGPGQGRPRDAGPGPRGLAGPEPRRAAAAAGLGRDRRVVVPGHRRHLPRRPPPARPPRRPAPPPGRRRASGPRSPSATPRSSPPATTAWPTAAPWRRATGPTWWWSTTWSTSTSGSVVKDGRVVAARRPLPGRARRRRRSTARTRSTSPRSTSRPSACPLALGDLPGHPDRPRPDRHPVRDRARSGASTARWAFDPDARRRPDRQHRAAPGERPGRPGAGRRLRPVAPRGAGLVGGARLAQPDRRRDQPPRHARLRPGPGRARRRLRRRDRRRGPRACCRCPSPACSRSSRRRHRLPTSSTRSTGRPGRWAARWPPRSARSRSWPCRSSPSCGSPPGGCSTSATSNSSSTLNRPASATTPRECDDDADDRSLRGRRDRRRDRRRRRPGLHQPRHGPDPRLRAEVGDEGHRGPLDLDVGLHPDLHARLVADRRGDELVAGGPDDLPGQLDRPGPDGPQRPRRHEVRHPVPGLLPGVVRHPRGERPGPAAGPGRLRLVRHPDLDRRLRRSTRSSRSTSRPGSACRRLAGLGINAAAAGLLPRRSGRSTCS